MLLNDKFLASIGLSVLLAACGGGGGSSGSAASTSGNSATASASSGYPNAPVSCTVTGERAWLRDHMNAQYFWYDKQAAPTESASSMAAYFDSMLFKPTDRYSWTMNATAFNQYFSEGKAIGYGYSAVATSASNLTVRYVEPLSPVGLAGMKRGDSIVSINGISASQVIANGIAPASSAGVTRSFVLMSPAGVSRTLNVVSAEYDITSVLGTTVLHDARARPVGYMMFKEFISTSAPQIAAAIDTFRAAGVQDVILDLRYNGGGSVLVAQHLSVLLGGADLGGRVFGKYRFNAKRSAENFDFTFPSSSYTTPLSGLNRLFVITSPATASASELVINNLRPYRTVTTIGETSYGKPYGMEVRSACENAYLPITFQIVNASGFGEYANGLPPTCAVATDDFSKQFGDPSEARTAAALQYINTGSCPPVASGANSAAYKVSASAHSFKVLDENGQPPIIWPGAVR